MAPYWIAFGDVHNDLSLLPRIPGLKEAEGIIVTGDLTLAQGADRARGLIEEMQRHNPVVLAQIGNMDHADVTAYLEEQGANIHLRARILRSESPSVGLIGVGASTPTPFGTPSEFPESQIGAWLEQTWEQRGDWDHTIVACHTPPINTATDEIGGGQHVGSTAVRSFIKQRQPVFCLTGHIHESRGVDTLGATTVINPGNFGAGGYVRLEFGDDGPRAELLSV